MWRLPRGATADFSWQTPAPLAACVCGRAPQNFLREIPPPLFNLPTFRLSVQSFPPLPHTHTHRFPSVRPAAVVLVMSRTTVCSMVIVLREG